MSPAQLRSEISNLGLTQREFAEVTGVDERTVRRWVLGERRVPAWVPRMIVLFRRSLRDPKWQAPSGF